MPTVVFVAGHQSVGLAVFDHDVVADDVAVRAGLGSPLKGHAYGVDPIDDEPRPDDWEPVGVAINSV